MAVLVEIIQKIESGTDLKLLISLFVVRIYTKLSTFSSAQSIF